jgi:hypothetical protein
MVRFTTLRNPGDSGKSFTWEDDLADADHKLTRATSFAFPTRGEFEIDASIRGACTEAPTLRKDILLVVVRADMAAIFESESLEWGRAPTAC